MTAAFRIQRKFFLGATTHADARAINAGIDRYFEKPWQQAH